MDPAERSAFSIPAFWVAAKELGIELPKHGYIVNDGFRV